MDGKAKFNATAYKNQFNAENYDRVYLTLPKGFKAVCVDHAAERGEKLNAFVQRAIRETIERDTQEVIQ